MYVLIRTWLLCANADLDVSFLKGEVLFDRLHPSLPPDVIVSAEDDVLGFEVDLENIRVCAFMFFNHFT